MADDGRPTVAFETSADWAAWLAEHHAETDGVWIKLAKAGRDIVSVSYAEAIDVALCYGWIDGQKRKLDDDHWLQGFTPRRARSRWSRINRQKAEDLIAAGRMERAGLREVDRAKADGRWQAAYDSARTASVPADLQAALAANPAAAACFADLDGANRYAILYRLQEAKKPDTRARRLTAFVEMLAKGERIHPVGRQPRG